VIESWQIKMQSIPFGTWGHRVLWISLKHKTVQLNISSLFLFLGYFWNVWKKCSWPTALWLYAKKYWEKHTLRFR